MLCEPSGYVWNVLIYCGKLDPISGFGHAETAVLKLIEKLLDCGRVLYVDNFYTSVSLAEELLKRKRLLCGTLRKNKKHLPKNVVSSKYKKGQQIAKRKGRIIVQKWKDKRDVMMLTIKMITVSWRRRGKERKRKSQSQLFPTTVICVE